MVRAALALAITVLSGIPQSTIVKAQAVGGSGGFLEISSVFFGESGRTFMAGEVIALSGAIPYIGGCLGQLAHGGFLPQGRGEGRFDPFPTADFYVIADTGGSLGLLQKLNDVSGGVNRVIGLSSGAFVDETIAVTQPAGNLGAGRFDVVMDQCLDGYFDPGIDIVLGEGQSYAFEVVLPGTLPALSLHAVKEAAGVYAAFLEDNDQDLPGGARIEVPGFCTRFNKWQDSAAIDAASSFGIWTAVARNKCVDLTKHYKGIQDDPPDPNYTQFAELGALSYHEGAATSPLERAMRTLAGVMSDQAATARAILTTLERFQGARQAGDDLYTVLQLEELNKFIHLLTDGGGSALRFYAALEAFDIALAQDPSGQSAEATALREGLLTMRRAIGGLITPFGAGFVRKVLGPGQEVLLPNGLRAWTEVYLGRNPFLPPLGLPGIPQTRAFAGLPALAFQHPDALFLGPLVSPPHRPLAFDATRSTDPNGDPLTFAWDFDGDGAFDDDAGPQPQHTFPEAGTRLVGVKATDTAGNTDVFYELVKIGDVNSQDIIARSTFGELLRIRPDGSVVTLNPTQGGAQALHVDVNGDTWVLTPENLEHYDANGAWLKTISVPQFAALAGTPLIQFHDFAIDGRGDLLVLATQNRGPGQIELTPGAFTPTGALQGHVTLYRMPKDASSVSFVAAVHEPWVMTTIDGLQTALLCSTGAAIPGLALDRNGDVVVAGVNGLNAARNQQGIFAVDPHSGQTREVVPAGRVSNCAPVGDDPRFPPYFGVIIAVGGQSLNIQLGGGRSSGGLEVDSQGHYVMGRGNSVAGPVRLYRVPMPPTMTFQPLPGLIAGQVLLDVFPTYLSPFPSPAFIAFSDIAIDSSGDYLVGGDHTTLGRGIFRIDPTGILSRVSDARGPFSAIRALDVVPDIREVTPKDIPLPPSIRLSNLTVDQQGCPGDIDIDVVLTNTGTDAVAHPIRVWFWNGDPGAGGTVIGTADVSSLGAAGAQASFRWANPPAGTATIFVTAEGANSLARAQYVCASLPAPQSDTIVLSPATATHAVGTQHVVTATMLDIYGRPLAGAPLTFQVDGANTTTGTAVTDAAGVATFHYDGTHAGEDTISASFVGATSNDALAAWSGVGDMTPPILTLPANLPVPATSPSGATVTFVASATDNVDGSVPVTCSAMSGALFGLGTTTVDCLASDAAGNTVTGTFVVTVAVGAPRIAGSVAAKGRDQAGNFFVDVRLANTGTGHARNVGITLIPLRTLGGTGIVTLNGALSPPLPVSLGALDVGASTIVRLYLHVPGTVSRLSVTESGPLTNVLGTVYAYSTAQAVIP
jgi:PKD repeat protein